MVDMPSCPSAGQIRQLLRGEATPDTAELFAQHLETCSACAESIDQLLKGDVLVEAMRARPTDDLANSAEVQATMQRLLALKESQEGTTASQITVEGNSVTARPPVVRFDFLAPPQTPEELGRLGPYRVLEVLGSGGMGVVFRAEDGNLKRTVALKVMRPEAAAKPAAGERFLREAQAAARLEHEHIVTIYHVGTEQGVPYLAMQWLRGVSLEQRLQQGPLDIAEAVRLARQVAQGLAVAHANGLIHRDIKPGNLWLESSQADRVKILDFGLACAIEEDAHLTPSGAVVGTPAYLAPEQAQGMKLDHRCDLFSLGVVLYRLLTGQLPFRGSHTLAVLTALATQRPRPLRELNPAVPPALAALVMQLLSKDPAGRPASAQEVVDRLRAIERQLPIPATAPPRRPRRRWLMVAAVALLVLVPLGSFYAGTIARLVTNRGILVVDIDAPDIELKVIHNGVVVEDRTTKRSFELTAGDGTIEVYEKASGLKLDTRMFTLTRGGRKVVTVVLKPRPSGTTPAAVAEWVLSVGGTVTLRVDDKVKEIHAARDLPDQPFDVMSVHLVGKKVTDGDLASLAGLKSLQSLNLRETGIGDAGLSHLAALTKLERLNLSGTRVSDLGLARLATLSELTELHLNHTAITDRGLSHVARLQHLRELNLSATRVGDGGLVHLRGLRHLHILGLSNSQVGDTGLAHLSGLKNLSGLNLSSTRVSDAGLAHLEGLTNLTALFLVHRPITDRGLVHLRGLRKLTTLKLTGARVSDAGLAHLRGLKGLNTLWLSQTAVTDAGLAHLKELPALVDLDVRRTRVGDAGLAQLPQKEIQSLLLSDSRVSDASLKWLMAQRKLQMLDLTGARISAKGLATLKATFPRLSIPWSEPNRSAAEAVLALGGTVRCRLEDGRIFSPTTAADILPDYFRVTRALLINVKKPLDDVLGRLAALNDPGFDALEEVGLHNTTVRDGHLRHLSRVKSLRNLYLPDTAITDAGLAHLAGLTNLTILTLTRTQVSNAGLVHLAGMKNLQRLFLSETRIGDDGLVHLKPLQRLELLHLHVTPVTSKGMQHLAELKELRWLGLSSTKVTDAGLIHLQRLSKLNGLNLGRNAISDAGVAHLVGLKHLTNLDLYSTRVGDAAMAHLKEMKSLKELQLHHTRVTNAGLAHLAALPGLTLLLLDNLPITDAGLEHLAGMKNLETLYLSSTRITDRGLARVGQLTKLRWLYFNTTVVGDDGLAHLKGLTGLVALNLGSTRITDAGLRHLRGLKKLQTVILFRTAVTDASLPWLASLSRQALVNLDRTRVSAKGFADLKAALPEATLSWWEPNRTAAETILAAGGTVHVRPEGAMVEVHVKTASALPARYFRLTGVRLADVKQRSAALWDHLTQLTDPVFDALNEVDLSNTAVSATELQQLANLPALKSLILAGTPITDGLLANLKKWPSLQKLDLRRTKIDGGLSHLLAVPTLTELHLEHSKVSDTGLIHLKGMKNLRRLWLNQTEISDRGLTHLGGHIHLTHLGLAGTRITDTGLAALAPLENLQVLNLDGTAIRGVGVRHLASLPRLRELRLGCKTLTDLLVKPLAELKQLEKLSLAGSSITDEGLTVLHGLSSLKELDLTGTTKVTPAGALALSKALPACRILVVPDAK